MKLQTKYNRINIIATVIILLISGFFYYFILRYFLIEQLDDDLRIEEHEFRDYVKEKNAMPVSSNYNDQVIRYEATDNVAERKFSSIELPNRKNDDRFRQLVFPLDFQGKHYTVQVLKSEEETEDLIELIAWITISVIAVLLLVLFITNRFLLKKLWLPFRDTLKQLQEFNLRTKSKLQLKQNDIDEFRELNAAVTEMSEKVTQDYESLKAFTENASHEMQTPLAVINSKLELLIQSNNLNEQQMQQLQVLIGEIQRLSKLNKSLLLLAKIDNAQFHEKETVDLSTVVEKILEHFRELMLAKHIKTNVSIAPDCVVFMNEALAEIMVSNLLTNAIKHNINKGEVEIKLEKAKLVVANTGSKLQTDPNELFDRFRKDRIETESPGLGLSIVKKICDNSGFSISYAYSNCYHVLSVFFGNREKG